MRRVLAGCLAVSALGFAAPAAASECGSTSAGWNAPNGAVVLSRSDGPIKDVLNAVGEYRTHSMLSHGANGGVTHATMKDPAQNGWPSVCATPLNATQLQYGYPGLEQINQGGIYHYLYDPDGSGPEFIAWQLGDATGAATVADTMWFNHPYTTDASLVDSSQVIDRPLRNGDRVSYSLYQYRDLESVASLPGNSVNNGMVCSTFLAYAHNYAGRGFVSAYTYPHDRIASAADSLYTGIYNHCKESLGWFQNAALTVICPVFWNVCGNAGNQVANCMTSNRCDTSTSVIWRATKNDGNATATSISPDRIGGWGVHPVNTTLWATDYSHQVQWNSGGNVYGCWQ
ncbi:hypothetical protein DRW03_11870 [Corallococcus sp. H22C18031201]|uniref:hypothetical protein n=1 Tax=Citreicoccus inhibens TaxID=2849499 RepID=UPI000E74ACF4|nr:hypothetical protein [Citreicoccus inhibens]MBU8894286.1 hypothetical protein [Citreicoccus inhibens]RJS23025.1 hypothetical protein DRW03_11870 [Corallococcus sp. H22C18031201]